MSRTTRTTLAVLLGAGLITAGVWASNRQPGRTDQTSLDRDSGRVATTAVDRGGTIDSTFDRDVVDRDAIAALERMGAYLRTLEAFQVEAMVTREDVLPNGQKVQRTGSADLLVQRPNRMRAELSNDQRHRFLFYDGKTFTLWADVPNYYATAPAPGTLAEFADKLRSDYGIEIPLEDLFHWGTSSANTDAITSAFVIGPSRLNGVTTEQYAFRQEGLDWQIWIQPGDHPLPRKIVLTTLTDEARPQHTSVLSWNLAPSFNEAAFEFAPPRGAEKIRIVDLKGNK